MKLAKIEHIRCSSYDGDRTYVWIPDAMTADAFGALVDEAQERYLAAEQVLTQALPVYPGAFTADAYPPEWTLQQARDQYAQAKQAYQEAEDRHVQARFPFSWHLCQLSPMILDFMAVEPWVTIPCDWGHRHGTTIDYGETKAIHRDLQAKPTRR